MPHPTTLYTRIRQILESARMRVARSVNTTQVVANWLIGREIVEEEQRGKRRAGYGKALLLDLAERLRMQFGPGYSVDNLEWFRAFYLKYPALLSLEKSDAPRRKFTSLPPNASIVSKGHALRGFLEHAISDPVRRKSTARPSDSEEWQAGRLHPNLAWTHYRKLTRVERPDARAFYEIEAVKESWSARELERQIASLLFERLAKSRDKAGVMRLATKGHEITSPADIFKDPVVIEFLGLPESHRLAESDLEQLSTPTKF